MKVVKKPIEFEAHYFDGNTHIEQFKDLEIKTLNIDGDLNYYIATLEGPMEMKIGDVVIKGIDGEYYAVNSVIFYKTYNIVEKD